MSLETQPKTPPQPKEPPQGISTRAKDNPSGKRARFLKLLEKNWQSSDPKFWRFRPDHRFRFPASELWEMEELVTPKELEVFLAIYDHIGRKMRTAELLGFPYYFGEWWIVKRERQLRWEEKFEAEEEKEEEFHDLLIELDAEDLVWDRL